jgi:inner membrane protease ATP23
MHMFDRCVAKVDFKNADHLACMEVRKANLASCNFMNYLSRVDANLAVKKEHRECVKKVALENLIQAKFVDREVAKDAVDRVFSKCYGDLEPIGRRLVNQKDFVRMRDERYLFGYN